MEILFGKEKTKYGPGVQIDLTGNEVAMAIYNYLTSQNTHVSGVTTITVNGELCEYGGVYVYPSGRVVTNSGTYNGKGYKE